MQEHTHTHVHGIRIPEGPALTGSRGAAYPAFSTGYVFLCGGQGTDFSSIRW